MSGASAAALSGSAVSTVWPMTLDLSKDDCKRALRSIELQAYAGVVSAFRAQGELTKDKKKMLQELQRQLSISTERHRAEVRRAVNDEKLTTIADQVSGPSVTCDWLIEGRRLVPLMPRLVPQTAFTVSANQASSLQLEKNAQMPSPGLTVTHNISGCIVKDDEDLLPVPVAAATSDRRWQTQPQGNAAMHYGSGALSAGGSSDGTDRATSAGCSATSVVTVGSSSSSVLSKAPVVTTKVVAPAGVQTPMKVTVTKPQMAAGSTQKLILVNASHSHATASPGAGSSSSAKSLTSQAVMLTKPAGTAGSGVGSQPKTSVVYPASQAHSPGGAGITVGTSPGAVATGSQLQHSLTITRPRPKAVAGPAGASSSAGGVIVQHQQQVNVTATSAASRLRMPGPSAASPTIATSVVQAKMTPGGTGTALVTAGPQPVSPAAGTRPSVVTSAIAITTKPGIQIKQEGAMKIITSSSTSKQLLPKAAGSQTPIVVVTSTAAPAASTAAATGTTGSTVGATVVRSITTGGQVHVTASGKVIGVTSATKAGSVGGSSAAIQSAAAASAAAAAAASGAPSSLVSVSGKPGASIIAHQGTAVTAATVAAATAAKAPASPALTVPRTAMATVAMPSAVKSCTVIVQNPPQRQPAASAVGGNAGAVASSAAALASSAMTPRLQRGGGEAASSAAAAQLTQGAEADQQAVVGPGATAGTAATATVILSSGRSSAGDASAPRSVASAAGGVVPPTVRVEGPPVELSLMTRPSILAGLMQSDTSAALVASPASSTHIILDHVSTATSDALSATGAVAAGDEVWLLTADGSGIAEQASTAAAVSQTVAEVVVEEGGASSPSCHLEVHTGVAEHVTVSSSSVEVSGGGQSDEPVGSQAPPQFDIFSSALAEAQIDLDPYEYSDEVSTSGGADDPSAAWTATAAEPELITVVDALASLDASAGGAANCIVSDGSSSLLSGTDACVTVAEYQEVSEEFVQAISQCGAVAGDGVAVAVIEGTAAAAAAASALADDTAVLASVCLAAPADAASDFAAATAPAVEPVVVQLGGGLETGVVTSVGGDVDVSASSCDDLRIPGAAANRQPEVVVVVSGTVGQAADSAIDIRELPTASALPAEDDLVSEEVVASTTPLLPPLRTVSATTEQVAITHVPEVTALSQLSSASVPSPSPDRTSPASGISPDDGDVCASSATVARLTAVSSEVAGQAAGDAIGGCVLTLPAAVVGGAAESATVSGIVGLGGSSGIADLAYGAAQRKRKTLDAVAAWDDGLSGSWTKAALSLMHKVMKFRGANRSKGEHNASAWFLRPVSDDEAPGYSAVVHTPMDFGTIKRKLEAGTYAAAATVGIDEFHADVTLVRANCSLYNPPEHCVRRDCDEVMAYYEREFERTFGRLPPPSGTDAGSSNANSSNNLSEAVVEASAASPKRCKMSDDSNSGTAT